VDGFLAHPAESIMTDEPAFLQAINEEPDERAHRLAYADWLLERGGADAERGDFLRVQDDLWRRDWEWDPEHFALEARAARLERQHGAAWRRALAKTHGPLPTFRFRHGLAEEASFADAAACVQAADRALRPPVIALHLRDFSEGEERFAALPGLARIRELHLVNVEGAGLSALARSLHLTRLTSLNLEFVRDTDSEEVEAFLRSPLARRLNRLSLYGADDVAPALGWVPRPPALRRLSLELTTLPADAARNVTSAAWAGLAELCIHEWLDREAADAIIASEQLGALEVLNLSSHQGLSSGRWAAFLRHPGLTRLCVLGLDFNAEGGTPADLPDTLAALDLPALRFLDLRETGMDAAAAEALARSPAAPRLVGLKLDYNPLGKEGVQAIAAGDFRALRFLGLSSVGAGYEGVKALARAPWLSGVACLQLAENGLGPAAVKALATSPHVGGLRVLNLNANQGLKAGLTTLVASPRLTSLEVLSLAGANVTEAQMHALAAGPLAERLVSLDVGWNRESLGERGAYVLAASGRMKRLQDLVFDRENAPEAIAEIETAFGPGVVRIDRPGD
jgi:uncharacterized protein (TIGR02996 family)